jgi:DNA-binding transcriptional MocR family regulator
MSDAPRRNIAAASNRTGDAAPYVRHQGERWAREVGRDKALNHTTRHVLLVLATYRRRDTGIAWASADTLADDTGLSVREVRRAFGELERSGVLEVRRRPGWTSLWVFPLPVENPVTPATQSGVTPATQSGTPATQSGGSCHTVTRTPINPVGNPAPADENADVADPDVAHRWLADMRASLEGDGAALADRLELERYGAGR